MKKTLVSLAAASLIVTSAVAADKGIDIVTTGQAVMYYETQQDNATGSKDMFDQSTSQANVGVQLNLDADLKNNFTFGSQISYLGTAGLEKNVVSGVKQDGTLSTQTSTTDQLALSKIFIAKKIGNSTVKIGRQELPKSLSPFAYSEGWNVFKNTFDAILAVNTDIPDTTLVGAYVSGGTGMDLSTTGNLKVTDQTGASHEIKGAAYMLTVQNKSIPMTTLTASYYNVADIGDSAVAGVDFWDMTGPTTATMYTTAGTPADHLEGANIVWLDAAIAGKDLPMGLKIGLQGGQINPESNLLAETTAYGVRVGLAPIEALSLCAVFTSVDGDDNKGNVAIKNVGTGIKSPLFSQMIYNQDAISLDANTFMLKAAYNTGDYGTVIAQGAITSAGDSNLNTYIDGSGNTKGNDYNEFDLIYKVKAANVEYFAAYIYRTIDQATSVGGSDTDNRLRVWARYNF